MRFLLPRSRAGMLWRFFAAAVLIICSSAAAVATAGLLQVSTAVQILSVHEGFTSKQVKIPKPGAPETIFLIGSDHRYGASFREANTDTMLLLRLNSASSTINVLSIPRDLKVDVAGYGIEKLNAAYSQGGYSLLIKTIRSQVFPGFYPNHVIDTNFQGFSDIVDAIGCVYSDVDHRYYNLSQPAPSPDNYSSIDIQPGYQKLCGDNQSISGALPFVRFRHTDTDIVRNARQQDFLRWAKDGYPITKLISHKSKLLHILSVHSTFDKDLQTTDGLLNLFNLVAFSDGDALKQITFPAILGPSFVTAEAAAEQAAYRRFLTPTRGAANKKTVTGAPKSRATHVKNVPKSGIDTAGLSADPADGLAQAKALTHPGMPVYYPRLIASDSDYCVVATANCDDFDEPAAAYAHSYPRQYLVRLPDHQKVPAYRMTLVINSVDGTYYGIQGVEWKDPPLLNNPTETKVVHGRTLYLYADDGGRLTQVAWHQGKYTYWVSNTLTSSMPNHELVGIAASMVRYRG